MLIKTKCITELCLPYKVAVTCYEKMATDIAAYRRNTSNHFRSSQVAAI